jgi:transposase
MVGTMKSGTRIGEPARRQHDRSFKANLVEQSLQPGASVAVIARHNGINANLLFKWRRDHERKTNGALMPKAPAPAPTVLLPVHVEPVTRVAARPALEPTPTAEAVPGSRVAARGGVIEVEIAGALLRLRGAVDEAMLSSVVRALRRSE